jgi:hypothetical protein
VRSLRSTKREKPLQLQRKKLAERHSIEPKVCAANCGRTRAFGLTSLSVSAKIPVESHPRAAAILVDELDAGRDRRPFFVGYGFGNSLA